MSRSTKSILGVFLAIGVSAQKSTAVSIDTVAVGAPGNDPDTRYAMPGFGAVGYSFEMGKFEITAGQYTEFLNAVARTDTYGLYTWYMGDPSPPHLGVNIQRHGLSGSYIYSVAPDWTNRPVNYVSWGDAARLCNWMTNGQPSGGQDLATTEDGSYYLNGAIQGGLISVTRKPTARYVIPTEDEWYKAAYFDPNRPGGPGYYDYPTGTDGTPSNTLSHPDAGNNANFYDGSFTVGSPYFRTEVGAFENSESPFGTFDQGGNVWEWNEAVIDGYRGVRGGSFNWGGDSLNAASRSSQVPGDSDFSLGFRVAEVPEPATLSTLFFAGALIVGRRRWQGEICALAKRPATSAIVGPFGHRFPADPLTIFRRLIGRSPQATLPAGRWGHWWERELASVRCRSITRHRR